MSNIKLNQARTLAELKKTIGLSIQIIEIDEDWEYYKDYIG